MKQNITEKIKKLRGRRLGEGEKTAEENTRCIIFVRKMSLFIVDEFCMAYYLSLLDTDKRKHQCRKRHDYIIFPDCYTVSRLNSD